MFDIAIVGAGFSGSVMAERFASLGRRVVVLDKRQNIGGNAFDFYDRNGIMIHKYGPHFFHTNDRKVFEYLSRFTEWRQFRNRSLSYVDGKLVPFPINRKTLEMLYGEKALENGVQDFLSRVRLDIKTPRNAEENVTSRIGRELFEKFFAGYTEKQWGIPASQLRASVTARIPVIDDYNEDYFSDRYQVIPLHGYTSLFNRMLDSKNIKVMLQTSWEDVSNLFSGLKLIYTGPVDEYFNYKYGHLPYRSLHFKYHFHEKEYVQEVPSIKYPNDFEYTRTTEFKHITGQKHPHTVTSEEYPSASGDPYYPIPSDEAENLYMKYRKEAESLDNVRFIGRLGTYRYYNMDQCVAAALHEFDLLREKGW